MLFPILNIEGTNADEEAEKSTGRGALLVFKKLGRVYTSLRFRIIVGVVATVIVFVGLLTIAIYKVHQDELIDTLRESTTMESELIKQSLTYSMMMATSDLLQNMIDSLALQDGIENIMVIDKSGEVKFAADPKQRYRVYKKTESTCMVCHNLAPEDRSRTVLFLGESGQESLRNVNVIVNEPRCHGCHSEEIRNLGILIIDFSLKKIRGQLIAGVERTLLIALPMVLAIIAVIWFMMNYLVLSRLQLLRVHTGKIAAGNLDIHLPDHQADELGDLSRDFNTMTHRLRGSIREVLDRDQQLQDILNSTDDGILVVDQDLRIVMANQAFGELCGMEPAELVGRECCSLSICVDCNLESCAGRAVFSSRRLWKTIRQLPGNGGQPRYYEIYASPEIREGRVTQVIEVWRDITDRYKIERFLQHSETLSSLGLLASGISHEINNPLASISACIDGLARRTKEGPLPAHLRDLPEYLELVQNEVERCKDLTGKLLILSRKPMPTRSPVDINRLLAESASLVKIEAQNKGITILEEYDKGMVPILADGAQIHQVFLNLILNALQAAGEGKTIKLRTIVEQNEIVVEVEDNGPGIAPDKQEEIFEPFVSFNPSGSGTGLGLFITRQIMEQHSATIRLSSTPGKGTTFALHFQKGFHDGHE